MSEEFFLLLSSNSSVIKRVMKAWKKPVNDCHESIFLHKSHSWMLYAVWNGIDFKIALKTQVLLKVFLYFISLVHSWASHQRHAVHQMSWFDAVLLTRHYITEQRKCIACIYVYVFFFPSKMRCWLSAFSEAIKNRIRQREVFYNNLH